MFRNSPGKGFIELRAIPHDKSQPVHRVWTKASTEIIEFADKWGEKRSGYSVYFGVCKRTLQGGKKADVIAASALWVDIDTSNAGWDLEKTLKAVYTLKGVLQPSAVIRSGGGLHLYWLLDEDYALDGDRDRIAQVEDANAALAFLMGGDSVHDVTRVMRLPGTWNSKRGASGTKRCEVVYCYGDDRKDIHELLDAALSRKTVLLDGEWVAPSVAAKAQGAKQCAGKDKDETVKDAIGYAISQGGKRVEQSLSDMWRDRVRYKPGRGYIGVDEAVMVTTARLWCKYANSPGDPVERVVNMTMWHLKELNAKWEGGTWSDTAQRDAIRVKVMRWVPKWAEIRKAAEMAKKKAARDDKQPKVQ